MGSELQISICVSIKYPSVSIKVQISKCFFRCMCQRSSNIKWKLLWLLNQLYFTFPSQTIIQLGLSTLVAKLFVNVDVWCRYYHFAMAYSPCLIINGAEFFVDKDTVIVNTSKARKLPSQDQPYNSIFSFADPWSKSLSLTGVKQHGSVTMHIFFPFSPTCLRMPALKRKRHPREPLSSELLRKRMSVS